MIIFEPQNGMSLPDTIKEAIDYAKVLYDNIGYGYVDVHFQDLVFGVNEKSNFQVTIDEVFRKIKYKYQKQGGLISPMLERQEYWIDKFVNKEEL